MQVKITINGKQYEHDVEPRLLLVHYIREKAKLTGTHVGCDTGNCGACTVLYNGRLIKSCLMLAVQADGQELTTVEALALPDGKLNPLQEAMRDNHGLQCGFCTPGVLMTLTEHLRDVPNTDEKQVREALSGHLCRCTGYQGIVDAALDAAQRYKKTA